MLTTIDSVAYPLYNELFTSVIVTSKQKQPDMDAWGMVDTGFDLIEESCFGTDNSEACKKYRQHRDRFQVLARNIFGSVIEPHLTKLKLSQLVRMTTIRAENNSTLKQQLLNVYREIALTFGDPEGKLTPMAIMYLIVRGYKESRHADPIIADLVLDDASCNKDQMEQYFSHWKEFLKKPAKSPNPCLPGNSLETVSVCCGYISQILMKNWNMTMLAMSYAIPQARENHFPLLEHLGLKLSKEYKAMSYNILPLCRSPLADSGDNLPCSRETLKELGPIWTDDGIGGGFNAPAADNIFKVRSNIMDYFPFRP